MSLPCSLPPRQQSKRPMQLGFVQRRSYQKKLGQALQRGSSSQHVARPRSHPLQQLALCKVQQLSRRRLIWSDQSQKQYAERDHTKALYDHQIRSADPGSVAALKQNAQADYDRRMVVIRRFNLGPADVVGGATLVDSPIQHFVQVASLGAQEADVVSSPSPELADAALSERQRQIVLVVLMADVPWPSSATIRSTPRRPGAPFAVLPH